ncbi:DISP complex protein LRCH3-like isoform X1 [Amphibalanus amphitrite]|uniref:DISP complex protein LRCH3-like isoform X1 n=1 Tax=Amphibalanus amphitrite TaxID=1232801 RepID=UPI001C8FFB20|nr:DISP complex protein LRCH3-like isoform X1 [Amphibalanus amphitrite]
MAVGPPARTTDKVLEESQLTGELRLSGRGLKEMPGMVPPFPYEDLLVADLSKNRLSEIPPGMVENGRSLEELDVHHNCIRGIPERIHQLRNLTILNLSRNQLTFLPPALCALPRLEVLIVSYNKLVSLPEEIGQLTHLTELDSRCNEINQLPVTLKRLESLVSLSLRRNSLQRLPDDIHCLLGLRVLDVAENQIKALPLQLRLMSSLEKLVVTCNPLEFPPATVCARGRLHIYKFLEIKAVRGEQEERHRRGASDELELRSARPPPVGGNDVRTPQPRAPAPPPVPSPAPAPVTPAGPESRTSVASQRGSHAPPKHEAAAYSGYEPDRSSQVVMRRFEPARSASGLNHTPSSRHYGLGTKPSGVPSSGTSSGYSSSSSQQGAAGGYASPPSHQGATGGYSSPPGHQGASGGYSSPPSHQSASSGYSSSSSHQAGLSAREKEAIERLRQNIEGRLHVSLPDDLRSALGDGVVLCHLANHVRPRAVSSIHVPSPAVPKLNEAKCRRNLQNFLEACRRIGVEEEPLRSAHLVARDLLPAPLRPVTPPPPPPPPAPRSAPATDAAWLTPVLLSTLVVSWLVLYLLPEPQ